MDVTEEISIQDAIAAVAQYAGRCSRSTLYRWLTQLEVEPVGGYLSKDDLILLIIWAKAVYRIRNVSKAARAVASLRRRYSPAELAAFAYNPQTTFTKQLLQEVSSDAA